MRLQASDDKPGEECGIFGVWSPEVDVARLTFFGIYALQHRGQESAGICTTDGTTLRHHTGVGLVSQVFDEADLEPLDGTAAIGHTRYSTNGSNFPRNAQPIVLRDPRSDHLVAIAHNGNAVNAPQLRQELAERGHDFQTTTDTELLGLYLLDEDVDWPARFKRLMRKEKASYSLLILTPDRLMAARDPLGLRPLCIGMIDGGYVVASETCALDHIGAKFLRDVEPGELITIDSDGLRSVKVAEPDKHPCVFEQIYFARPDSIIDGQLALHTRQRLGHQLAIERPAHADIVIGVPDSAIPHAMGYARGSGIEFAQGLVKNRYVGRTFIREDQRLRELGVRLSYNAMRPVLDGRRVVVVDDTIVRGTTTPRIVELIRNAGAKEVHVRISAPAIRHPCFFGVDMAQQDELIAHRLQTEDAICEHIGADSLGYLSVGGLLRALDVNLSADGSGGRAACLACFTGQYPVDVQGALQKKTGFEQRIQLVGELS